MSCNAPCQTEPVAVRTRDPRTFQANQRLFGEALLNANLPVPDGVVGPGGKPAERRFNVYRNNVVTGQVSTLGDAYPVTARLVGDVFFKAMARAYVLAHPPATPMMFDYGADFPAFIDTFSAARELPYLGDVARIERGWVEAYHSPEATPLTGLRLRHVLADSDLHVCTLLLHPSMRVMSSSFPALKIWEMNIGLLRDQAISLDDGQEEILLVRPSVDVQHHRLPKGGAAFLLNVARGFSLVKAAEQAFARDARFDLVANMASLVDARLVIGMRAAQGKPELAGA